MSGIISPSIMCGDFLNLSSEIKKLIESNVTYIHIDFMDNKFVPNITFNLNTIKNVKKLLKNVKRDIHIMAYEPQQYFDAMEIGEGDLVSIHYEACQDPHYTLSEIKKRGALPSLALDPSNSIDIVKEFLDEIHSVLLMTVYPGFAGQPLAPNSIDRLCELKKIITDSKKDIKIEVDGHVSWNLCKTMRACGADIFVAGSSSIYQKNTNIKKSIIKFKNLIK